MARPWVTTYQLVAIILSLGLAERLPPSGEVGFIDSSQYLLLSDQTDDTNRQGDRFKIQTSLTKGIHSLSKDFLSMCIDTNKIKSKNGWLKFITGMKKLEVMAAALSPSNLRLGGTNADFITFSPDGRELDNTHDLGKQGTKFILTGEQWVNMTNFARNSGWDIMWDFNQFKRRDGLWDPRNAELFLNYSDAHGIEIPAFELGNEPNNYKGHFNITISVDTMMQDYRILRNLLSKYLRYAKSKIYGPDTANVWGKAKQMINRFANTNARGVVDAISVHQYYMSRTQATAKKFMDPKTLDSLKFTLTITFQYVNRYPPPLPVRLTETSSAYGGGNKHLSNAYVAGFLWLDKLGVAAQYGVEAVYRQNFFGGNYGVIASSLFPNPDYFLSVLFKRLVEGSVLKATSLPASPYLRLYTNCARTDVLGYPKGAVVFYFLNLGEKNITLSMTQFQGHQLDLFLLTPGDEQGLESRYVKLNGQTLLMSDSGLPSMTGAPHTGDVTVTGQSFGFIVDPHAKAQACL